MRQVRAALTDLTDGIRWRALIAAWALTLIAVAVLAAADASAVASAIVLGGAASMIALAIAGAALTERDDGELFEVVAQLDASFDEQLVMRDDALMSELRQALRAFPQENIRVAGQPEQEPDMPPAPVGAGARDAKSALAVNLRRLRKERHWSQEMLAHFAGLHPTEVTRLERGLREPRLRTVMQVAAALRVPVHDLIAQAEQPVEHTDR
jgi:DNA-binding XRE family transcriptional regulator